MLAKGTIVIAWDKRFEQAAILCDPHMNDNMLILKNFIYKVHLSGTKAGEKNPLTIH